MNKVNIYYFSKNHSFLATLLKRHNRKFRLFLIGIIILFFSLSYANPPVGSAKPLIYNEEALTEELKGRDKEEVLKILGNPAVKKPCEECEEDLEQLWYNLPGPVFLCISRVAGLSG